MFMQGCAGFQGFSKPFIRKNKKYNIYIGFSKRVQTLHDPEQLIQRRNYEN